MVDIVDTKTRSRMMSGIRGKNTKPEIAIRKRLFAEGFRYRIHDKRLPGKPDLVLPKYSAVIFVNGCFWHGHDCKLFKLPSSNQDFWKKKIGDTVTRDVKNHAELIHANWRVLVIWECAIRGRSQVDMDDVIRKTAEWISSSGSSDVIRGRA